MNWRDRLYDFWRRWFGSYTIDDPRPIAAEAPYTYHLPSENELLALAPGDIVKAVFRSHPPGREWDAERMWVKITGVDGESLSGTLENDASDMPQLHLGSIIRLRRSDVIDIDWPESRTLMPPSAPARRWYWERCLVDRCVLEDGARVHYLYREEPETPEGDEQPDSGWRIRGDYRDPPDDAVDSRALDYIALGKVLNIDDSWLPVIDAPIGSCFLRDWSTDTFEAAV